MAVPEEYGGGGNPDFRYNVIVTEETTAGRYSGIGFGLHNDVVAPYLLRLANEEQKQRWLPKFCTGEIITAIAMTEPGTGSDLQGIKTRAVKEGDHYVLNGAKTFITNGINADLVIVVALHRPGQGRAWASRCWSSSEAWRASSAAANSTRSVSTRRTPRSCRSPT